MSDTTRCINPSSPPHSNAAASYYNRAFDIVAKITHSDSKSSRPTSADEDSVHSVEIERIKSRREASRIQYHQILFQRNKSPRSPEKGEDSIIQSKITCETDSEREYNVPVELYPSSLKSVSSTNSPLSQDTRLATSEDPWDVSQKPTVKEIVVDEKGANFETIIGGDIDNSYNDHDSVASETETHLTLPATDDESGPSITDVPSFAQEHSIFVQAILQLLTERDLHSTKLSGLDNKNTVILMSGTLKKVSHHLIGVWKNKFVELRAGNLSYHEYVGDDENYTQLKSIPLRASSCTCRVIEPPIFAIGGAYVFELLVGSGQKRFWMANSAAERDKWVNAIESAIIGSNESEKKAGKKYKPKVPATPLVHYDDREIYLQVQKMCKKATSKTQYMRALSKIDGKTLNVPVHWVKENISSMSSHSTEDAFREEAIDINVEQFWKDIMRDTVSINDKVISGDLLSGPEKIVGCLTRVILDMDRIATKYEAKVVKADADHTNRFCIKESEAVFYARDLLLSSNRTKSGGHSYYCASTLCNNPSLVVVVPNSSKAEPISLTLRHTASIEDVGDKIWKNDESLLSEQLKINIVPSNPQCKKTKNHTHFFFPRVLPILRHLRIPHNLNDYCSQSSANLESKDGSKITTSNFTAFSSTGEEKIIDDSNGGDRVTVEVLVHVSSEYKICTTDPSGDDFDDTWW